MNKIKSKPWGLADWLNTENITYEFQTYFILETFIIYFLN